MNKIVEMNFGSRLYGTSTPASDIDIKGVYLPTADDILLGRIKGSVSTKRPKGEGEKNYAGEVDEEYHSLDKFLDLVYQGQTVAIDMLFVNPENIISKNYIWDDIVANRDKLISRKSEAFIGYCMQQAKKYGIKGSRVAAVRSSLDFLKSFLVKPSTKLREVAPWIANFVSEQNNEFVKIEHTFQQSGVEMLFFEVCGRKIQFNSSLKEGIDILQRLMNEYGTRALMAETNTGVDWKALSHAVRIAQQAVELFETHNVVFPRHNAAYLLDIKQGRIPYVEVAAQIEDLFEEVKAASLKSTLQEKPDKDWIENFIIEEYRDVVVEY